MIADREARRCDRGMASIAVVRSVVGRDDLQVRYLHFLPLAHFPPCPILLPACRLDLATATAARSRTCPGVFNDLGAEAVRRAAGRCRWKLGALGSLHRHQLTW
jgi:hypothetical protein